VELKPIKIAGLRHDGEGGFLEGGTILFFVVLCGSFVSL